MKYTPLVILFFFLLNCRPDTEKNVSAQSLIDDAIELSGGQLIDKSTIEFDFRDKHYKAMRHHTIFSLERHFNASNMEFLDSIIEIRDVLNNKGFQRFVNGFPKTVPDSIASKYAASLNSVHYFSVLPYGLNAKAVQKELLTDISIKEKHYHTIRVTFTEDGGGEDFEDVFLYWVNRDTKKVDYLAYSYNESDGKGLRFRVAFNERYVSGIRFVDYHNYKPKTPTVALTDLPQLFEKGKLILLSEIELKHISVKE